MKNWAIYGIFLAKDTPLGTRWVPAGFSDWVMGPRFRTQNPLGWVVGPRSATQPAPLRSLYSVVYISPSRGIGG